MAEKANRVFNTDEQKAWDDTKAKVTTSMRNITSTWSGRSLRATSAFPVRAIVDENGDRHTILDKGMKLDGPLPSDLTGTVLLRQGDPRPCHWRLAQCRV